MDPEQQSDPLATLCPSGFRYRGESLADDYPTSQVSPQGLDLWSWDPTPVSICSSPWSCLLDTDPSVLPAVPACSCSWTVRIILLQPSFLTAPFCRMDLVMLSWVSPCIYFLNPTCSLCDLFTGLRCCSIRDSWEPELLSPLGNWVKLLCLKRDLW